MPPRFSKALRSCTDSRQALAISPGPREPPTKTPTGILPRRSAVDEALSVEVGQSAPIAAMEWTANTQETHKELTPTAGSLTTSAGPHRHQGDGCGANEGPTGCADSASQHRRCQCSTIGHPRAPRSAMLPGGYPRRPPITARKASWHSIMPPCISS